MFALAGTPSAGTLSLYAKVVGLIPSQSTYRRHRMSAKIRGTTNQSLSLPLSLKSINKILKTV